MRFDRDPGIIAVLIKMGNATAVAEALGVTRQAISRWKRIPIRHIPKISELTGLSVQQIRPDLFASEKPAS